MPDFTIDPLYAVPSASSASSPTSPWILGIGPTHDFIVDPLAGNVTVAASGGAYLPTPPILPTPAGHPPQWFVRSIGPDNAHHADYSGSAIVKQITWTLNSWEEAVFEIPLDIDVSELPLMNPDTAERREVQILLNGTMMFQGIPVRRRVDAARRVWEYTAFGMLWFLSRRYVGRGKPINDAEAISFTAVDQVTIAQTLVQHAQGLGPTANLNATNNGKTDLRIHLRSETPSGVLRTRSYPFGDHQNIFDALRELASMDDGFDFDIDQNVAARTFRVWYPQIGQSLEDIRFEWIRRVNPSSGELELSQVGIVDWSYQESIEDAANDVTELAGWGSGDGSRLEATSRDAARLSNTTLELIESAPEQMANAELGARAHGRVLQRGRPAILPQITLAEPRDPITQEVVYPLIGVIKPGDLVKVLILDEHTLVGDTFRISQIVLDAQAQTMACTIALPDDT